MEVQTSESLSVEESQAIAVYKEYQKKLPNVERLGELWLNDFDVDAYPGLDQVSALQRYIDTNARYVHVLEKAAHLRQCHHNLFLGQSGEDDGHRFWREGMNAIAIDARLKLNLWTKRHEELFSGLITEWDVQSRELPVKLLVKNVDYEERASAKSTAPKKAVSLPVLSQAEKKRRKIERQRERKEEERYRLKKEQELQDEMDMFQYEHAKADDARAPLTPVTATKAMEETGKSTPKIIWQETYYRSVFHEPSVITGTPQECEALARAYFDVFMRCANEDAPGPETSGHKCRFCARNWRGMSSAESVSTAYVKLFLEKVLERDDTSQERLMSVMIGCPAKMLFYATTRFRFHDLLSFVYPVVHDVCFGSKKLMTRIAKRKVVEGSQRHKIFVVLFMISAYLKGWYRLAENELCGDGHCQQPCCQSVRQARTWASINDPLSCLWEPKDLAVARKHLCDRHCNCCHETVNNFQNARQTVLQLK